MNWRRLKCSLLVITLLFLVSCKTLDSSIYHIDNMAWACKKPNVDLWMIGDFEHDSCWATEGYGNLFAVASYNPETDDEIDTPGAMNDAITAVTVLLPEKTNQLFIKVFQEGITNIDYDVTFSTDHTVCTFTADVQSPNYDKFIEGTCIMGKYTPVLIFGVTDEDNDELESVLSDMVQSFYPEVRLYEETDDGSGS